MNNLLKYLLILLFIYHNIIFYLLKYTFNNEFKQIKYCICGSNVLTNTYYICSYNKIQKYFDADIDKQAIKKTTIVTNIDFIKVKLVNDLDRG